MPHLDIRVAKKIDAGTMQKLQLEIGNSMELIPGKTISNTVIAISDGVSMFKGGVSLDGAFVDVRLYKESPAENKKEFSEKMFKILEDVLQIPPGSVQMNFVELPDWASSGVYR